MEQSDIPFEVNQQRCHENEVFEQEAVHWVSPLRNLIVGWLLQLKLKSNLGSTSVNYVVPIYYPGVRTDQVCGLIWLQMGIIDGPCVIERQL